MSKVPLGNCDYDGEIVNKRQLYSALNYSILSFDAMLFFKPPMKTHMSVCWVSFIIEAVVQTISFGHRPNH